MNGEGVFSGVRVVELAQYVYVPGAGVMLADHGAEVIKVEMVGLGDPYRTLRIGDGRETGTANLAMEQNNRNKRSIALDLKSEEGREALLKLVETADVFVTSLRPKAIRALRLNVDDLRARNPGLIYVRGNGLGFKGAEADRPGFDASVFWARGGVCWAFTRPGQQPTSPRPAFGDHSGSMAIAFGIAGALYRRAATGEPSLVENSLLSTATWMLSSDLTYGQVPSYSVHGMAATRQPLKYAYTTQDGRIIQFMILDPRPHWRLLCEALGLPELADDPRFAEHEDRVENCDELIAIFQERIGAHDYAHWKQRLETFDGAWELIATLYDVANDPQVLANDILLSLEMDDGEQVRMVAGPVAFDGRTVARPLTRAPDLGADTDALLAELGYSGDAIADMRERGVAQ